MFVLLNAAPLGENRTKSPISSGLKHLICLEVSGRGGAATEELVAEEHRPALKNERCLPSTGGWRAVARRQRTEVGRGGR